MTTTGLDAFDRTVQTSNRWLKELGELLGWQDRHGAYLAFRATMHALRDRLPMEEMVHLGAQLPLLLRGTYYDGWDPEAQPLRLRRKDDFLALIVERFRSTDPVDAEHVARAVFAMLANRVSAGEIDDVTHMLPEEIRDLWPGSRPRAA